MNPELLEKLTPEWVAPVVAVLAHKDSNETTGVFELGAGFVSKFRIERSTSAKVPIGGTSPQHILKSWSTITSFGRPSYAQDTSETTPLHPGAQELPQDSSNEKLSFNAKVAVVFGAGTALGRQYALFLAKTGTNVVVNATSSADANKIVTEIKKAGGRAKADINPPENGSEAIKVAVKAFGAVHILIYALKPRHPSL
jgi:multifunctional beta-oxidation protein